jgi:26S proteasome regulatory subunit T4
LSVRAFFYFSAGFEKTRITTSKATQHKSTTVQQYTFPSSTFISTKPTKEYHNLKTTMTDTLQDAEATERQRVLEQYRAKIREHRETEARLKQMRDASKELVKRYQKTEDDLSALQSVGQIIGDVLKKLDADKFIVKASSGPRYVVGCRSRLNHDKLKPGTRVALDMTTLTIMRVLPREVDPTVFHMQSSEEDGGVSYSDIGGLNEQIRELREVIELPLTNPELFIRVGIKVCHL